MKRISAVLLAAGESRRMGELNKLGMDVGGESLLRRTANILLASELQEVVVVLGHETDKTLPLLEGLPLKTVTNEFFQEGQMTSVYKGLQSLSKPCDGVMICLSDQPLLESEDINTLISAFAERGRKSVLVPTYMGKRGNPIILENKNKEAILTGDRNLGCKRLIEKNPDLVMTVEMDTNHVVVDLDTPQDYADFKKIPKQEKLKNASFNTNEMR